MSPLYCLKMSLVSCEAIKQLRYFLFEQAYIMHLDCTKTTCGRKVCKIHVPRIGVGLCWCIMWLVFWLHQTILSLLQQCTRLLVLADHVIYNSWLASDLSSNTCRHIIDGLDHHKHLHVCFFFVEQSVRLDTPKHCAVVRFTWV